MVDYSKWDKLDCSDSEEEQPPRRRPRQSPPPRTQEELLQDPEVRRRFEELMGQKQTASYHPQRSLHKDLFDPDNWKKWLDPKLVSVIADWQAKRASGVSDDFSCIDLDAFLDCNIEAPGIISFPAYNDEFCEKLLEEVKNYHTCGMPSRAPNSMNNYGLVLNEIGLRPVFSRILKEAFLPLGAKLFGADCDRVQQIRGERVGTENWGGSTLDDHHTFVVQYRPSDDKHLDMHIDECDVTFNFGITPHENFEGNDLTFCGMFDSEDHRKFHHMYKHVKGRCVVHSGKRRHELLTSRKASVPHSSCGQRANPSGEL